MLEGVNQRCRCSRLYIRVAEEVTQRLLPPHNNMIGNMREDLLLGMGVGWCSVSISGRIPEAFREKLKFRTSKLSEAHLDFRMWLRNTWWWPHHQNVHRTSTGVSSRHLKLGHGCCGGGMTHEQEWWTEWQRSEATISRQNDDTAKSKQWRRGGGGCQESKGGWATMKVKQHGFCCHLLLLQLPIQAATWCGHCWCHCLSRGSSSSSSICCKLQNPDVRQWCHFRHDDAKFPLRWHFCLHQSIYTFQLGNLSPIF